jgi:hypothetical protein
MAVQEAQILFFMKQSEGALCRRVQSNDPIVVRLRDGMGKQYLPRNLPCHAERLNASLTAGKICRGLNTTVVSRVSRSETTSSQTGRHGQNLQGKNTKILVTKTHREISSKPLDWALQVLLVFLLIHAHSNRVRSSFWWLSCP